MSTSNVVLGRPVRRFIQEVQQQGSKGVSPQTPGNISDEDIKEALQSCKCSASVHASQYEDFSNQYGQSAD